MTNQFFNRLLESNLSNDVYFDKKRIEKFTDNLFHFLFQLEDRKYHSKEALEIKIAQFKNELTALLFHNNKDAHYTQEVVETFFDALPQIYFHLLEDAQGILDNDPAATCLQEIFIAYPGFYAIAIYRFAHQLHLQEVRLIPRIWTEYGHSKTGIDIHPAAVIGHPFCIDHGTGIVIGETCVIGTNVKLYQGVTLGAISVSKEKANTKRHPTIENNVVIYAGATILGGETTIGENSVIGGNVWITKSVAPNSIIYSKSKAYLKNQESTPQPINFII